MKKTYTFAYIALGLLIPLSGCLTPKAAQAEGSHYQIRQKFPVKFPGNHSEVTVRGSVAKVHRAILAGLKDLKIRPITNRVDNITANVDALFADSSDLEINVETISPEMSKIIIRCGMLDDFERSRMVFQAIEKHL